MTRNNPFRDAARSRKVVRLVAQIHTISGGQAPVTVLAWAEGLDDAGWRKLAICAGCNPPSEDAKREVIAALARVATFDAGKVAS